MAITKETPAGGPGLMNSAGRRVQLHDIAEALVNAQMDAHEMPWDCWRIWADGFHVGQARAHSRVDRAEHDADFWYMRAHYSEAEIAEFQRRGMEEASREIWDAMVADARAWENAQ